MHLIISATKGNNLKLANELYETAQSLSMNSKVISLEDFDLPLYSPSREGKGIPDDSLKLTKLFVEASALIFIAPEYNGSLPPILNNAISWVSRSGSEDWRNAFNGKPSVVATHSGGGGLKVTQAMRAQLEHLGSVVLPRPIITNFQKPLNPESASDIFSQLKKMSTALS